MGPDEIPNWLLKDFESLLAGPICAVFNSSISQSHVSAMWKQALPKVTPVTRLEKDLMPIALTLVLAKVLESFTERESEPQPYPV